MTHIDPTFPTVGLTGLATVLAADATGAEPWVVAVIVVPLAAFTAWVIRWIMRRAEEREKATEEAATRRETREERRAEQSELQTRAMQECVAELRLLRDGQQQHSAALEAVPKRIAELIGTR